MDLHYDGVWNEQLKTDGSGESAALTRDPIEVTDGRGDEQGAPTPSTCSLTLDNLDGRYNPRNLASPLFGRIGRNTPIRVSVLGDSYLRTTADGQYASTPDHSSLDITGDIDIRVDCQLDDYTDAGLVAKMGSPGQQSFAFYIGPAKQLLFWWSANGTTQTGFLASPALPVADGDRIAVRVTLDVDNGAGQRVVQFFTAGTIAGPWTQHGSTQTAAGTTSIFASTAPLEVGGVSLFGPVWSRGRFYAAEVYAGAALRANPKFGDRLDSGAFTDALGRTWTPQGGATVVPDSVRFVGEVSSWKPRRAIKGDARTLVEAAGVLRRLTQGEEASLSPWRRIITSAGALLAYWPCEDDADSTAVASALSSVDAMTVTGTVAFADSGDTFRLSAAATLGAGFGRSLDVGSDPLPNLAGGGKFVGSVPPGTSSPLAWTVSWVSRTNALQAGENIVIARWFTPGGTYVRWDLVQKSNGLGYDVFGYTTVGGAGQVSLASTVNDQVVLTEYRVVAFQNGTNTQVELYVAGNQEDVTNFVSVTNARVTSVEMNPDSNSVTGVSGFWVGHVQVWDTATAPSLGYSNVGQPTQRLDAEGVKIYPWLGWLNERATDRLARLFAEQGVPFRLIGARTDGLRMGPQPTDTWTGLLAEVERTDVGILADDRYAIGMTYRTRFNVYDQSVSVLPLDFTAGEILPPLDPDIDDLGVRNDVTVKRSNGSSARSTLEAGTLSVLPPPTGIGRVSRPIDVNPALDSVLPSLAAWYRYKGTVPGTRYSQVTVDVSTPTTAALAATRVTTGDRLTIANIPDDEDAALQTLGRVETIGSHTREIAFNAGLALSPLAVETFSDPATNGWGFADTGQTWTVELGTLTHFSVTGGRGRQQHTVVGETHWIGLTTGSSDVELLVDLVVALGTATGAPVEHDVIVRETDTGNNYRVTTLLTGSTMSVGLLKSVGGVFNTIAAPVNVPGHTAGAVWRIRARIRGTDFRARMWLASGAEPSAWTVSATLVEPATALVSQGTRVVLRSRFMAGNTNPMPQNIEWDNLRVLHPQVVQSGV